MARRDGSDLSSTVARGWEDMRAAREREWENRGVCDDRYYKMRHIPCGSQVLILMGHVAVCPKCQPEEYAKQTGKK